MDPTSLRLCGCARRTLSLTLSHAAVPSHPTVRPLPLRSTACPLTTALVPPTRARCQVREGLEAFAAAAPEVAPEAAEVWRAEGHGFLGRRVLRTYDLGKTALATIVRWLPAGENVSDEPMLFRVVHDDGDEEDLEEDEADEAVRARPCVAPMLSQRPRSRLHAVHACVCVHTLLLLSLGVGVRLPSHHVCGGGVWHAHASTGGRLRGSRADRVAMAQARAQPRGHAHRPLLWRQGRARDHHALAAGGCVGRRRGTFSCGAR